MPRFDDYHRTVVGYHGTGLTAALRIVNRIEDFRRSEKDYDWLGRGVYFWEYAPRQALSFAETRQRQFRQKKRKTPYDRRRATEPLAVVACMIRLGYCLDLTAPENVKYLGDIFDFYKVSMERANVRLPKNSRKYRRLDRAVFEYAYEMIETTEETRVDTARGVYVPTDHARRIWEGSWIAHDTHIQVCVRNPASILGTWLHHPTHLEVNDVCEALQARLARLGRDDPPGEGQAQEDVRGGAD